VVESEEHEKQRPGIPKYTGSREEAPSSGALKTKSPSELPHNSLKSIALYKVWCKREERTAPQRPGAVAYTGSLSRGVREGVPVSEQALLHRGRSTKLPSEKGHMKSMPSGMRGCKGVREGVKQC
jgi:hypothetical protein